MTDRISDQFRSAGAVRTNKPAREKPELLNTPNATYWDRQPSLTWDEWAAGKGPVSESAGAVRTNRRPPPTCGAADAHAALFGKLLQNKPHEIIGLADDADLEERAEHLEQLLKDVEAYVTALVADCRYVSNVSIPCRDIAGIISDVNGDVVGALKNAADELRGTAR